MGRNTAVAMNYSEVYSRLHANPKHFQGMSIRPHVPIIAGLVEETRAATLLDFGSGKGYQYLAHRLHEQWGGILPHCYDVGVAPLSLKPTGRTFHGVISTDVLEHIEERDVDDVLADVCGYATRFVFLAICCRPSKHKTLPDGRNLHVTLRPPEWWRQRLDPHERAGVILRAVFT
jgi:hypothetical protein